MDDYENEATELREEVDALESKITALESRNAALVAMVREIVAVRDAVKGGVPLVCNQGQPLDGYSALANYNAIADRLAALLRENPRKGAADER